MINKKRTDTEVSVDFSFIYTEVNIYQLKTLLKFCRKYLYEEKHIQKQTRDKIVPYLNCAKLILIAQ